MTRRGSGNGTFLKILSGGMIVGPFDGGTSSSCAVSAAASPPPTVSPPFRWLEEKDLLNASCTLRTKVFRFDTEGK